METVAIIQLWLLAVICLYLLSLYQYWRRKGLPQPTPLPLVGNVIKAILRTKNFGMIYNDLYWQYRDHDAVGVYEFLTPKLIVIKPELIKQVLVSEFSNFHDNQFHVSEIKDPYQKHNAFVQGGEKWKPARNKLIQSLTTSKMREMFELMKLSLIHLDRYIEDHAGQNMKAEMMTNLFTMTNISNTVFGIMSDCFSDCESPFRKLTNLLHREYWTFWWQTTLIFYLPKLRDLLGYRFMPESVSLFVEAMVKQVAESRMKNDFKRNDYIQFHLSRDKPYDENVMDMIYNGMVFFIAGTETSALTATNSLYALAQNPVIQETLYQELEKAHKANPNLDYDTVIGLPYLDKVLHETLRKYPILYGPMKVCTQNTVMEIDGKEVKIEAGTLVTIPTLAVHHDPQYYPDPDVFDPERFSEDNKTARPECTYLPWGEGPRICAGKKFAIGQVKLYLSHIVYNYNILPTERTPPKLTYGNFAFMVTPDEEIWIRLEKRK